MPGPPRQRQQRRTTAEAEPSPNHRPQAWPHPAYPLDSWSTCTGPPPSLRARRRAASSCSAAGNGRPRLPRGWRSPPGRTAASPARRRSRSAQARRPRRLRRRRPPPGALCIPHARPAALGPRHPAAASDVPSTSWAERAARRTARPAAAAWAGLVSASGATEAERRRWPGPRPSARWGQCHAGGASERHGPCAEPAPAAAGAAGGPGAGRGRHGGGGGGSDRGAAPPRRLQPEEQEGRPAERALWRVPGQRRIQVLLQVSPCGSGRRSAVGPVRRDARHSRSTHTKRDKRDSGSSVRGPHWAHQR